MKKKTNIILLFLALTSFLVQSYGQETPDIKLKRVTDSLMAVAYYRLANDFMTGNKTDSALANISKSVDLASENGFLSLQASGFEFIGSYYDRQSDWDEALSYYLKASSAYTKSGNYSNEARMFRLIAGKYYKTGVYNKSAAYSEQEFLLYGENESRLLASAAETAGKSYFYLPADSLSLKWYSTASHYFLIDTDSSGYLRCIDKMGMLYTRSGKYDEALGDYNILSSVYAVRRDYKNLASTSNQAGFLMFRKGDLKAALDYFSKAIGYSEKGGKDDFFLTDAWSNVAICQQNMGNQNDMLSSFNRALEHAKVSGRSDEVARIDRIIATIYFNKGDNYHAEKYCLECIESAKESGNHDVLQLCYKDYSTVLESGNDFIKALEYYEKHLNLRDSLNYANRLAEKERADRIAAIEESEQRIKSELSSEEIQGLELKNLKIESRRKENELKLMQKQQELDRSEKVRLNQSLVLERERFELNERVQENKSLKLQQANDSLSLIQKDDSARALVTKNQLLEKDKLQKETELKNEKLAKRFALGVGSLMLLVAASILYGLISTRKKNQKLAESKRQIEMINSDLEIKNAEVLKQKDIIEQKNQAITDSIQYASRIQTAVLPPISFLSDWGIENFILYKPKDIVSGDFYWGVRKNNKIILAAGDCTGHGVPGAFMSMLGHAFLDEIVNTREPENAAAILDMLRDEIINALKQKGMTGEARDGMDISLVILDPRTGRLDYAGANNPLYLIRDGKMVRYIADRMPIGIHFISFTPFTNQVVEIKKGDYLYIFSDGYADQFGGPKGKKFMYKPFQDLLLRNHSKPMELQKEILDNTFEKWKNDREQVDDVLVIGIRI
jgi:serine phosphatase RsbU (regulator of sigma subunit)/tetratricopeptide (TPR) repeat protein